MNAIRVYLLFMGLLVAAFFVVNMVQANQTGRGLGVHDTSIVPADQARLYHETVEPRR
jgi:hypothetical protein